MLFELATFTVELRADLGGGERSLVELAFREFTVRYERLHALETSLQVRPRFFHCRAVKVFLPHSTEAASGGRDDVFISVVQGPTSCPDP